VNPHMSEQGHSSNGMNGVLRVLLDTNIYCQDFQLRTSPMGLLLDESKHGRAQLLVPVVVLQETTRRFAEEVRQQRQTIVRLGKTLRKFGIDSDVLDGLKVALNDRISAYPSFFRSSLERHGARFLDLPDVSHQKILDRVLARRKPISEDGKRGYQDTLIWETLLSLQPSKDNIIYFITANWKDFGDKADGTALSQDLLNDLVTSCGDSSGVVLVPSLKDFTDVCIKPGRELLGDARRTVSTWELSTKAIRPTLPDVLPLDAKAIFTEELALALQRFFEGYEEELVRVSPDQLTGDIEFDEAYIEEADFERVQVEEVYRISEEEIGVSCEAEFDVIIRTATGMDPARLARLTQLIPRPEYTLTYNVARYEGQLHINMELTIDQAQLEVIEGTPSFSWVEIRAPAPQRFEDPNQGRLWDS
jgi:hypothetical protein